MPVTIHLNNGRSRREVDVYTKKDIDTILSLANISRITGRGRNAKSGGAGGEGDFYGIRKNSDARLNSLGVGRDASGVTGRIEAAEDIVAFADGNGAPESAGTYSVTQLNASDNVAIRGENLFEAGSAVLRSSILPSGVGDVDSVFGRIGAVSAQVGDYSFSLISGSLALNQIAQGGASDGQVLTWNDTAGEWEPATGSGGGGGLSASADETITGQWTFTGNPVFEGNGQLITVRGEATDDANFAYIRFEKSNGVNSGFIGEASDSDSDIYVRAQQGHLKLRADGGEVMVDTGNGFRIRGSRSLFLESETAGDRANFDMRDGNGFTLHKNANQSGSYVPYREAWYDGDRYHIMRVQSSGWVFEREGIDGDGSPHEVALFALPADTAGNVSNGFGAYISLAAERGTGSSYARDSARYGTYVSTGAGTAGDRWGAFIEVRNDDTYVRALDISYNGHGTWEGISYATDHRESSDLRLKSNLKRIKSAREISRYANLYSFTKEGLDEPQIGLIAQDLEKAGYEEIVGWMDHKDYEDGVRTLSGYTLGSIALAGVGELDSEVEQLKSRVKELEQEVERLRAA